LTEIRKKLIEHPYITVGILLFLYTGALLVPNNFTKSYYIRFGVDYFYVIFFYVILPFIFLILLWNLIIPYGLFLEDEERWELQTLKDYNKMIRLSSTEHLGRNLSLMILCVCIYYSINFIGVLFLGNFSWNFSVLFGNFDLQTGLGWFNFIVQLRAPVWEEIAFRGVILAIFLKSFSKKKAILLDGVIFGLFHFINFLLSGAEIWSSLQYTLGQMGFASMVGVFLAYVLTKTESLLPCIVMHYLINIVTLIFNVSFANEFLYVIYSVVFVGILPWIINFFIVKYVFDYLDQKETRNN